MTRLQRRLVRLLAPPAEAAMILEDLTEEAAQIAAARGVAAARRWVRWQIGHSAFPWVARRLRERLAAAGRSGAVMHRGLTSDFRMAARRLAHSPGFTALAVLTLAVGIGAVSAVFSLAHALWLKPLPYHEPERLVWIHARHVPSGSSGSLTAIEVAEHRRESRTLTGVAAFAYRAYIARFGGEPVRVVAHSVTPNLFHVLGVSPALGRHFVDADAAPGAVVMMSHDAWTRWFGRDSGVVGETLTMDGRAYQVVGVMPKGFTFPRTLAADVWVASDFSRDGDSGRGFQAIGRLAPSASVADAAAEATSRATALAQQFPATHAEWSALVRGVEGGSAPPQRAAFQALLGIVGLFLLIGCTNLAGLLLARNAARRAELAVCLSIGASPWRLARMLLVETAVLAALGCAAGVLLAGYMSRALAATLPRSLPGVDEVAVNVPVLIVAVAAAALAAALTSVLPAIGLRSLRPAEALAGSRTVVRGQGRAQRVLVVLEIALAVLLVVGASVMLRAFLGQLARDRGYDPNGLMALNVSLPYSDDSYLDTAVRARAFDDLLAHVAAVPGVEAVAATTGFPGSALGVLSAAPVTTTDGRRPVMTAIHAATPAYFSTMGIPITAGRAFTPDDVSSAPRVAIVNERLAQEFPGGNPIGQRIPIQIQRQRAVPYEIVGVVGDIRLTDHVGYRLFLPMAQASAYWIDLVVRTDERRFSMSAVRQALRAANPDLLLENESSFGAIIANSLALERAQSAFAVMTGLLSALVAAVGLYAMMTFAAEARRRELGIRLALGSPPARLFRETMASALGLVAVGLLGGMLGAAIVVRMLSAYLVGLEQADATAYIAAAGLLLAVSLGAAWMPARRAMRTDPLTALRLE